jgi:hypothetical protein
MRMTKYLALAVFTTTLALTPLAQAETPQVTALRESIHDLASRTSAVRSQAERASPELRRESERIVAVVEAQRLFLGTRLDLLTILGRTDSVDDAIVREMTTSCTSAGRLLAVVERWFRPR